MLASDIGKSYEANAQRWLIRNGLETVARNYRCRLGEIDLIMRDAQILVFVEVRFRNNHSFGGPFESITVRKQKRIILAANHFITSHPGFQTYACRFDAIGITYADGQHKYDWIKNAFSA
ncbi:MAG: YraN family protein [Proteobacteria bacterium]|nr:YraN family protein [Pseudomonadota bacterium]